MREEQSRFEKQLLAHLDGAHNLARWLIEKDQDAQAVVQEAYIQALKEIVGFRGADVRVWLLTIVRNTAYSWIQKCGDRSNTIAFEEAIQVAPSSELLAGSTYEERQRQLYVALSSLPVEFREILVLHEIEGWSCTQLASALDISVAMVESRLSRARRSLRWVAAGIRRNQLPSEL
jgi:RNA polymerase sigma factor (sigma-70 family)